MADTNGRIDISNVLNNTFGVVSRHPLVFLGLSFLIMGIPNALLQTMQGGITSGASGFNISANYSAQGFGFIALMILSILLQATLIVATVNDLAGKPLSITDCFKKAVDKFLPLLGLGIVFSIGIFFGFLLLIVPGVIMYLMWIVATPVMMTENTNVFESLKRSAQLTSGSKGMIFVMLILFAVLAVVIGMFVAFFGSMGPVFLVLITLVSNTITGALQGAGVASIYVDLRSAKEGADTDVLAEVFA